MPEDLGVEEAIFSRFITEKTPVAVFLRHGIKLTGIVVGYDKKTFLLKNIEAQLVYKDAISTITPSG